MILALYLNNLSLITMNQSAIRLTCKVILTINNIVLFGVWVWVMAK